jgi:hypothetical protein
MFTVGFRAARAVVSNKRHDLPYTMILRDAHLVHVVLPAEVSNATNPDILAPVPPQYTVLQC